MPKRWHGVHARYNFRVTGSVLKFEGFLKVYEEAKDSKDEEDESLKHKLPPLEEGQKLRLEALKPEQHFTEPPPRFNEASLVKELEERGIGRPSTYAAIISTIVDRGYVQKTAGRGGKFFPTEIGFVVTELLVANLKDIFDYSSPPAWKRTSTRSKTARIKWTAALHEFYAKFEEDLEYAGEHMENIKRMEKPPTRSASVAARRWSSSGASTAPSSPAPPSTRRTPTPAPSPRKIPSTSPTSVTPKSPPTTRRSSAKTAASPWSSSADASAPSWPAPAIPSAKPPAASIRAEKARCPARRKMSRMRTQSACFATDASASSSPAPATPSANTSSRT